MAVIYPNLIFERELQGLTAEWPRRLVEMAPHLLALGGPGDLFIVPSPFEVPAALAGILPRPVTLAQAQRLPLTGPLRPWGVSPAALQMAEALGIPLEFELCPRIAELNTKAFSAALATSMGLALPGAAVAHSLDEVEAAGQAFQSDTSWVLKQDLGFGGQGRLLARGPSLTTSQRRWAERALGRGPLIIEPWLERVAEYSTQLEVGGDGRVAILAVLRGLDTPGGRYGGSEVGVGDTALAGRLAAVAQRVGEALGEAGYVGPAGVDAFTYRDGAKVRLRPLVEVNARHTFGRVALEWARLLAGGAGRWVLSPADAPLGGQITSPVEIGGRPCALVAELMPSAPAADGKAQPH